MIHRIDGDPPFVIDRKPPAFIERAPGNFSLVSHQDTPDVPLEFDTHDEAVEVLRREMDEDTIAAYDWRVIPKSQLEFVRKP
jgi:hypothetical protein